MRVRFANSRGFLGTYICDDVSKRISLQVHGRAEKSVTIGRSGVCSEYVRSDYHLTARYSTAGEPAIRRDQSQITLIMKRTSLPGRRGNNWVKREQQSYHCAHEADIVETSATLSHSRAQAPMP